MPREWFCDHHYLVYLLARRVEESGEADGGGKGGGGRAKGVKALVRVCLYVYVCVCVCVCDRTFCTYMHVL